jgi:hypothetical protein
MFPPVSADIHLVISRSLNLLAFRRRHQARYPRNTMADQHKERRKHPRYACDVGVQVRPEGSGGGYWGTLADISLGGCYVYTFSPLTAGTVLSLTLRTGEREILAAGTVVTSHPGVGMGVEFSAFLTPEGDAHLKAFIAVLEAAIKP